MDFAAEMLRHVPKVRSFALKLSRNQAMADDLVQDTLLRAWAAQSSFAPGTNMGGWLHTICRNLFCQQIRREGRIVHDVNDQMAHTLMARDDTAAAFDAREVIELVFGMPSIFSDALIDAGLGRRIEDVAAERGLSTGTVKSRLNRARTDLAAMLGEDRRLLKQGRRAVMSS